MFVLDTETFRVNFIFTSIRQNAFPLPHTVDLYLFTSILNAGKSDQVDLLDLKAQKLQGSEHTALEANCIKDNIPSGVKGAILKKIHSLFVFFQPGSTIC